MAIVMNLYYTGENGNAMEFVQEMEESGVAPAIRVEEGNLRYDYFQSLSDPETVLLIDMWESQEALNVHHATSMMGQIMTLREKYNLRMRAERYVPRETNAADEKFIRKMSKIIFIDVDGTLVDYENRLPDSAVTAIRAARANGHRVYICTGRSKAEVYPPLWDIGLDGMIGGNGAYVEDRGQVVLHRLITAQQCRHIVDWLHSRGLEFYLESNNGLFASERFEERAQSATAEYMGRKGRDASKVTVRSVFPDMVFGGELYRDDVNKVSFVLNSYQDYLDSMAEFPDLLPGTWGGSGETALFGDLGVKGITKASAVDALLTHLGARREDTIAFGDAKVDIPMFEACACSVCMGNGGEEAKMAADYVTGDVDKDGLYQAFSHLGLI